MDTPSFKNISDVNFNYNYKPYITNTANGIVLQKTVKVDKLVVDGKMFKLENDIEWMRIERIEIILHDTTIDSVLLDNDNHINCDNHKLCIGYSTKVLDCLSFHRIIFIASTANKNSAYKPCLTNIMNIPRTFICKIC
jgi:hypothetical protein